MKKIYYTKHKAKEHNINQEIAAPVVRVVGEDVETNICSLKEALQIAASKGLDLVEILPNADPPVCKIMHYSKFIYKKKKKEKEIKSKVQKNELKEIRLTPNTGEHDLKFKINHIINFLKGGYKVKIYVQFMGRNINYKGKGYDLLNKLINDLKLTDCQNVKIDQEPKMEGKRMNMIISLIS